MEETQDPAEAVIAEVAEQEETSPDSLPAMEDWVDRETLDKLTSSWNDISRSLEFEYVWYRITVLPNREVVVTPG